MSAAPPPNPYQDFSQPPRKQGMSGCTKLLIVLGILGAISAALCCGAFVYMRNKIENMVSTDPAVVQRNTDEIVDLEIPEGMTPNMSIDVTLPIVGKIMQIVIYEDARGDNQLVLAGFNKELQGQQGQDVEQQMNDALNQNKQGSEEINVRKSEDIQRTIRGKEATFVLAEGEGRQSKKPRLRIEGNFEGKIGPSMIVINVDAEDYKREDLIRVIDSIN